jgi:hypothetical protein
MLVNPREEGRFFALKQAELLRVVDWKYLAGHYFPIFNHIIICILMES